MSSTDIETAVKVYLLTQTALTAYVGKRIHYLDAPDNTAVPYLVYRVIDAPNDPESFSNAAAQQPYLQFEIVDDDKANAHAAAVVLKGILNLFYGSMDGLTVGMVTTNGPVPLTDIQDDHKYSMIVEADMPWK